VEDMKEVISDLFESSTNDDFANYGLDKQALQRIAVVPKAIKQNL
jgi:hypothetical protein